MNFYKFFLSIVFALSLNSRSYIDYESPYHPVVGNSGMVVTLNFFSSQIGIEILIMGGNAVDAAVAVGFSLATPLPRAGNLGGGGFMLVYIKRRMRFFLLITEVHHLNSNLENIFELLNTSTTQLETLPKNFNEDKFDIVNTGYSVSSSWNCFRFASSTFNFW